MTVTNKTILILTLIAITALTATIFAILPNTVQATSHFTRDIQVLNEDFEGSFTWNQLKNGIVTQTNLGTDAVSGDFVARKTANNDPHGAIKQLSQTVDDFEAVAYAKKVNTDGGSVMRYSIVQSEYGNGYGFYLNHLNVIIEKRDSTFTGTLLVKQTENWDLGEWNTFRFFKVANQLTLELYKNQIVDPSTLDTVTPTHTLSFTDNSFVGGFNYAAINGGFEFDTDDYMVWSITRPALHLADLNCNIDQIAQFDGAGWVCAEPQAGPQGEQGLREPQEQPGEIIDIMRFDSGIDLEVDTTSNYFNHGEG